MKRLLLTGGLVCLAAISLLAQGAPASAPKSIGSFDLNAIDKSIDPCTDFYQFACGSWIKNNPIPPDQSSWGRFNELHERNQYLLRGILDKQSANDPGRSPVNQKIGDYYAACMDETTIESKGLAPIKPYMESIDSLKSNADLPPVLATLHKGGVNAFFGFGAEPDSAIARSRYAPAMPSTALPSTVITPAGVSAAAAPFHGSGGWPCCTGRMPATGVAAVGCFACSCGIADAISAPLACVAIPSSSATRRSSSRTRSFSRSTTDAIPSTVSITRNSALVGTGRRSDAASSGWLRTTPRPATTFSDSNHRWMFAAQISPTNTTAPAFTGARYLILLIANCCFTESPGWSRPPDRWRCSGSRPTRRQRSAAARSCPPGPVPP